MYDKYESPLSQRYASDYMLKLFSAQTRAETWRRLWVALARAQHKLGLPVTAEQVEELEAHISDVDFEAVSEIAGAITPVPGGVGLLTVAMLMQNVVTAAKMQRG